MKLVMLELNLLVIDWGKVLWLGGGHHMLLAI